MCVYLDVELSDWVKKHAMEEYRSFSSFLNKLMLDHKAILEGQKTVTILKSETKS
jgi:hypothetical protein